MPGKFLSGTDENVENENVKNKNVKNKNVEIEIAPKVVKLNISQLQIGKGHDTKG